MTNILELLKNEKVEWKKLGEVFNTRTGYTPSKKIKEYWENGTVNWFTIEDIRKKGRNLNAANVKISEKAVKKELFKKNSLILSIIGTIGEYALIDIDFVVNQQFMVFTPNNCYKESINMDFIKYYFSKISEYCKNNTRQSSVPTVDTDGVLRQEIPIPSLEIQEKIVKILDEFTIRVTELQLELQSELQSRTKQYAFYRDKLLSEEYLTKVTKEMEEDGRLNIVTLGEIGEFTRGNGLQKKDFQEDGNPVIHYGQIYTKYGFIAEKVLSYVNNEIFSKLRKAQKNDILIATTSENIEDVGKSVVWLGEEEIGFSGDMYSYRTEQNSKYIAYYFQTNAFQRQKERKVTGTKMTRIHGDDMEKFEIPLPPLSLQNKIVKVLDKFQVLLSDTKGLIPEEIEKRQKQYEYYREKLLTFDVISDRFDSIRFITSLYYDILQEAANVAEVDIEDKIEWKKISDICIRQKGINITAKQMQELNTDNGKVKVFAGGNTVAYLDVEAVGKDNIINKASVVVKSRGNIDFEYYKGMFTHKNEMWSYSINSENSIKYLYYYMKTNVEYFKSRAISGKLPQISIGTTDNYKVPIPPLHVQQHVVSILDKFDTLVNDLKEGLPKEIEQRQKQYEYWRECLLNFPR